MRYGHHEVDARLPKLSHGYCSMRAATSAFTVSIITSSVVCRRNTLASSFTCAFVIGGETGGAEVTPRRCGLRVRATVVTPEALAMEQMIG